MTRYPSEPQHDERMPYYQDIWNATYCRQQ